MRALLCHSRFILRHLRFRLCGAKSRPTIEVAGGLWPRELVIHSRSVDFRNKKVAARRQSKEWDGVSGFSMSEHPNDTKQLQLYHLKWPPIRCTPRRLYHQCKSDRSVYCFGNPTDVTAKLKSVEHRKGWRSGWVHDRAYAGAKIEATPHHPITSRRNRQATIHQDV